MGEERQHEGVEARPRYHHGNLPSALVEAALDIVDQEGLEALTLRAVARRVGVTHAAPYRHFRDKAALLAAVAEEGFRDLGRAMRAKPGSPPEDAGRALRHAALGYLDFALSHPARYRVTYAAYPPEAQSATLLEARRATLDTLRGLVRRCQSSGTVNPRHDPGDVALGLWAHWHGLASLIADGHLDRGDAETLLDRSMAVTRYGLAPEAPP